MSDLHYAGWMGLVPARPMIATLASALPVGDRWSYEVKWDGYRALLLRDGGRARLLSRNRNDLTSDYPHLAAAALQLTGDTVLLDGEIVALDQHGVPSFQALQHRSATPVVVVFYAFDLLHLGKADYRHRPLTERRRALGQLAFGAPILRSDPLPGTAQQIEVVVRKAGLEGVVAKRLDSIYESGRRSPAWVKVKFSQRQELAIGGYQRAGATFDSVLVGYYDGRQFFCAGKVGAASRRARVPISSLACWRRRRMGVRS